ncbi:MAG: hypothetical protein EOO28_26885 [Comamonadaceae bacterium]|nr:MAG: hypothetical protein EOO28_26885 [Comamonadaceae bacterium]
MLAVAIAVKLIAEIALCALVGQWLLGLLSGASRMGNPFYRLLQLLGKPFVWTARVLSPASVSDRHIPGVAVSLVLGIWLAATVLKIRGCLQIGMALCQ